MGVNLWKVKALERWLLLRLFELWWGEWGLFVWFNSFIRGLEIEFTTKLDLEWEWLECLGGAVDWNAELLFFSCWFIFGRLMLFYTFSIANDWSRLLSLARIDWIWLPLIWDVLSWILLCVIFLLLDLFEVL